MNNGGIYTLFKNSEFKLLLLTILVILVLIFGNNFLFKHYSEKYCQNCHIMKPDVISHKESHHSKVTCFTCHFRSQNFIADYFRYLSLYKCVFSEITDSYQKPLNSQGDLFEKIPSNACLDCHPTTKNLSPRLGIKINHDAHYEKGISCSRCHNRAAHPLEVTVRELTTRRLASIVPYDDRTQMNFCMECHTGLKGQPPSSCETCHTQEFKLPYSCNACHAENLNKIKPRDHFEPNFDKRPHARMARAGLNYCLQCHTAEYCQACHTKNRISFNLPEKTKIFYHPPASHFEKDFMPSGHSNTALEKGKDYCYQCHKPAFCNNCHRGLEMPHPEDFKKNHGKVVAKEGFTRKCSYCHKSKSTFCEAGCHHTGWKPEMGPMIRSHPKVIKATGVSRCLTCHTSVYCAICHVSGVQERKYMFRR